MHASRTQPQACSPLLRRYREVRDTTFDLSRPFSAEDQMLQSMPDCSPMKWHLAHTTWFFETFILASEVQDYRPFEPRFKQLFNSYYKQLGSHPFRGARGLMSRPSLDEVAAYRQWVDDAMAAHLDQLSSEAKDLVELGLNHEQQHQELMVTDIKHALWSSPLRPERSNRLQKLNRVQPAQWIAFEKSVYEIGHKGEGFAFDNECPRHEVLLGRFEIGSRPVTNSEYQAFMKDDGYRRPELWLSDGWDAVCTQAWNSPLYWEQDDDGSWLEFTFEGLSAPDPAAPVCHISYYEADAFARWSGARLPREEEWEVAAGAADMEHAGAFLESKTFRPAATGAKQQMFGNVWEWTASPYVPYPGFAPAPGLVGEYNGKFMCNQFVLRGGSCATPQNHIRATYRNFFPPHARWQFMGLRLAK